MPELLSSKTRKARKAHPCSYCGAAAVQPGGTYTRDTFVFDGYVYDWITCDPCNGMYGVVRAWSSAFGDEGLNGEDFIEWACDYKDDPEHGELARAFLVRAGLADDSDSDTQPSTTTAPDTAMDEFEAADDLSRRWE